MAPFWWPELKHEVALAKEVARCFPEKPQEWDEVAKTLSKAFSSDGKQVEVKGRGCREKMDRHTFEKVCLDTSIKGMVTPYYVLHIYSQTRI